jgi:transposase
MRTFAEFLKPVRQRLRDLIREPNQFTLVFDAGASSKQNLEGTEHYVTAVRPSNHRALLSQAAEELIEVPLSNGAVVRAWRSQRIIAGKQREVVVVFSPQLHEGQLRGLHQSLQHSYRELEQIKPHSRLSVEAVKRKLERICAPQYLRSLLGYKIDTDQHGAPQVCLWSDWQEYQRLVTHYFGLRVLITDRAEWSTAQIIEAYRGQAKAEAAFRDMKDPHMLSTRPQFHWTDQKLHVHAFICVTAYLLITLLHWRATQKTAYQGSSRRLLAELATIRYCRLIESTGRRGRPRVRMQIEEMDPILSKLAEVLNAIPSSD